MPGINFPFVPSILARDMFAVINGARSFLSAKREGSVEFEAETCIICLRGSHSQTTENFGAFTMLLCKDQPSGYLQSI